MKTFQVANTPRGRVFTTMEVHNVEKGVRTRHLDLSEDDLSVLFNDARRRGYAAAHGGGVNNSYGWSGETSAILIVPHGPRHYLVTVARGRAPAGPHGAVGPSIAAPLGCPWQHTDGRAKRLQVWSKVRYEKIHPPPTRRRTAWERL